MRFTSLCGLALSAWAAGAIAQSAPASPSVQCGDQANAQSSAANGCQWGDTVVIKPGSSSTPVQTATLEIRVGSRSIVRVPLQASTHVNQETGAGSYRLDRSQVMTEIQSRMASDAATQVAVGQLVARTATADVQLLSTHAKGELPSTPLKLDLMPLLSSGDLRPALHGLRCVGRSGAGTGADGTDQNTAQRCAFGSELRFTVPGLRHWWPADKHPADKMTLVLHDVVFKQLPRTPLSSEPPSFAFTLRRGLLSGDAVDPWESLLARRDENVSLEVSLGNDKGELLSQVSGGLVLQTGERHAGTALFLLAAVVFGVVVYNRPSFLRDAPPLDDMTVEEKRMLALSLGRTQMFFWTLFVAVAWAWLWWWTGTPFSFNQTALVLLGISAATAVGASAKVVLEKEVEALKASTDAAEQQKLRQSILDKTRTKGLWADLSRDADDDSRAGLHRVQAMAFTLMMGAAFAISVVVGLAMPHLPETALALMGISGSLYVGFKFLPAS